MVFRQKNEEKNVNGNAICGWIVIKGDRSSKSIFGVNKVVQEI